MNLYWYFAISWVRNEITALHQTFFPWWQQIQVTTPSPLHLLPLLVWANSKQGETLPGKQPAFPAGSRCFPPPRSLLSPNTSLLHTSQRTWANDSCPGAVGREPTPALCCPPSCLASLEGFINCLWHVHCGYQLPQEPYATLEDKI